MTQLIQRTKKIGGSLMVRIPKELADLERIYEGELVQIEMKKVRKEWFGAFPKLTSFRKEERMRSHHE